MSAKTHALSILLAALLAAPQQLPPRDTPGELPRTGTAVLRGRVLDAQTNRPLRRVKLSLTAPGIPPQQAISVSTDSDGRYEFTELPARQFTLTAERGGYLLMRYGQRRPNEQGKVVDLAAGQVVEGIDFALPRMAVISGRITDELGDPIADVWVAAMRQTWFQNRRQMGSPPGSPLVTTDENGEYRITNLPPGTYVVLSKTMERWSVENAGRETTMGYAPTYFPGVADIAQATRVTVTVGQEARNTNFSVLPFRAADISGRAVDSQGRPMRNVTLAMRFPGCCGGGVVGSGGNNAVVAADGSFTIANVPPGTYTLQSAGGGEASVMPITVAGVNITGVELTASPGWEMRGSVVTDAGPPVGLRPNQVTVVPVRQVVAPLGMQGTAVQRQAVNSDWTFSASNVVGEARLRVTLPDGWALKGITQGDRDLLNRTIELKSGEVMADVRILITDQVATVTGQVVDAKKAPIADGTVLLFSANPANWFELSPHVRAVRPDQLGRYRIPNLLPGEYLGVAIDYVEEGIWNEPEYLESIRKFAQRVTVPGPGSHTVSFPLVTP